MFGDVLKDDDMTKRRATCSISSHTSRLPSGGFYHGECIWDVISGSWVLIKSTSKRWALAKIGPDHVRREGPSLTVAHSETDTGKAPVWLNSSLGNTLVLLRIYTQLCLQRGLRYILIGCALELSGRGKFWDWYIGECMNCGGIHLNWNLGLAKSLPVWPWLSNLPS